MTVDILLTYPSDGLRLFQSMVPLGVLSVGTFLKKNGYSVAIVDFNHYTGDFRHDLRHTWNPGIIGIGGTTPSRRGSFLTARIAKQTLPDVTVVYGGVHASFTAEDTLLGIPEIDYVIQGEGEFSFLALCDLITGRKPVSPDDIPGLARRSGGGITSNKPQRIQDLALLPIPDRGILPHAYPMTMDFIGGAGDFIVTSRGCPAACNFCAASRMFPGGVRHREMQSVGAEIEYLLSRKKLSGLKLFDSTFTADRDHVLAFCDVVRRYKLQWECEIRADTVDGELLRIMKESGCYYINIGMETSSDNLLKKIAKGISPEQVLHVLGSCRELGIRSKVFFTFGHFGETFRECREDIRFIEHNKKSIDFFAVTVGMRIYPGTRLERSCREAGILPASFSWVTSPKSIKNLLVFEPGAVPVLFQKGLGPVHLFVLLMTLLFKGLVCTEKFLLKMTLENITGVFRLIALKLRHAGYFFQRLLKISS